MKMNDNNSKSSQMLGENFLPEDVENIIKEFSKPIGRFKHIPAIKEHLAERELLFEVFDERHQYFIDNVKKVDKREWIPDPRTKLMRQIRWFRDESYFEWVRFWNNW